MFLFADSCRPPGSRKIPRRTLKVTALVTVLLQVSTGLRMSTIKRYLREFPGGLVVKVWCCLFHDLGLIPCQGTESLEAIQSKY